MRHAEGEQSMCGVTNTGSATVFQCHRPKRYPVIASAPPNHAILRDSGSQGEGNDMGTAVIGRRGLAFPERHERKGSR